MTIITINYVKIRTTRENVNFQDAFEKDSTKKTLSILDLGCEIVSHALIFAEMEYDVTGIDQSETMFEIAQIWNPY